MKNGKSNIDIVRSYLAGERPFIQVGYSGKEYKKRKLGEKWEDNKGIEWEQKSSGPVRVNSVADIVRSAINDKCKCGQFIKFGTKLDSIFFRKTGLCENCLIDYETKLRIVGIYGDYENYKIISNEIGFLRDAEGKIKDAITFFSNDSGEMQMLCNSEGFIERWKNIDNKKILKDAKNDLKIIKKRIAFLTKTKKQFKQKYIDGTLKFKLETYAK